MSILLFMQIIININALKDKEGRIVGGLPTNILEFPYAVRFFNKNSFCSGTILNSWTVMTAAHCVTSKDIHDMTLGVGSSFLQDYNASIYDVSSFVIHEDFNKAVPFAADIALLFVNGPIEFSDMVQKAILTDSKEWQTGHMANIQVMGWGWTQPSGTYSESGLMRTTLRYVPMNICEENHNATFSEDMFCLYGDGVRDTCQGDSGGGVIWRGKTIGIVSHGFGCAVKEKPGIYINVGYYRKWIEKQIGEFVNKYCRIDQKNKIKKESVFHHKSGHCHRRNT